LSFDADILALLGLATVLATFSKICLIFSQSYGHPATNETKNDRWVCWQNIK
jgi:hypothetical protein